MTIPHRVSKPAKIGNSSSFQLDGPLEDSNTLQNHPSIQVIKQKANKVDGFNFSHVSQDQVAKSIKSLKNKAPGHDKISAKILKISSHVISYPMATLFNSCVDHSIFPSPYKKGEVTPGHKRGVDTDKSNYRPLSVLPSLGKVMEDLMLLQLDPVNKIVLHHLISAYRPGHSCQDVLLYIVTALNKALDQNNYAAAIATDLSSAFDCLPPNLMYH